VKSTNNVLNEEIIFQMIMPRLSNFATANRILCHLGTLTWNIDILANFIQGADLETEADWKRASKRKDLKKRF
jgi:hypothetical protein